MAPITVEVATNSNNSATTPPSQLPNNKFYNYYFPNFIIGLSILYSLSFLTRYFIKKYHRFRDKRQQQEKQRLRQAWKASYAKYQLKDNDSLLFEEKKVVLEFPPSSYYNESYYSSTSSSSTLNSPTSQYNSSTITFVPNSTRTLSSCSSSSSKTVESKGGYYNYHLYNKKSMDKVIQDVGKIQQQKCSGGSTKRDRTIWKLNNTKRLNLLWQWSVSMGYIEYDHAKDLNVLVSQLSTSRKQEYSCCSGKKEQQAAEEVVMIEQQEAS